MTAAAVTSDLMTEVVTFPGVASRPSKAQRESARTRFPPRQVATDWPTTHQERAEVSERLTSGMFVLDNANSQERRVRGLAWLLDWLSDQPGETWQQRWMASDAAGGVLGEHALELHQQLILRGIAARALDELHPREPNRSANACAASAIEAC